MESLSVEELLLILKIAFLVLLYLFIWRIVRSASRDIRTARNESFVLRPGDGRRAARRPGATRRAARPRGPPRRALQPDARRRRASTRSTRSPLTVGRGARERRSQLARGRVRVRAARAVEPRDDGVWLADDGLDERHVRERRAARARRKLEPGDVIRVGETDLRYEP